MKNIKLNVETNIPVSFEIINNIPDTRFIRGKIWVCHTGLNRNNSYFSKEVIQDAIPSLANIPVLGFIRVKNDNELDFSGHEQRIVIDKDGTKIEYLGRMYGIVPESNNAQFETKMCEDGIEREFLTVEVLLHTKFKECIEIVQRDGVHNHSMELFPDSIQGKFNKNGVFEFSRFMFEGLCLLGEDVTPAMIGSSLELFSRYNYHEQLTEMLVEFNSNFSTIDSGKINETVKGGEQLDEKLELFTKFPTLQEEDIADLKENLDQFSLEEIEEKLNQILANKNQSNSSNVDNNFSLTANQLKEELKMKLAEYTHIDRWGDSCRQFWYIDHDENRVYAEDGTLNYMPVGINYILNGDIVTLDVGSKKRVKFVPQDIEDGTEVISTIMSVERNEYEFNKNESKLNEQYEEINNKFTKLESDFDKKNIELENLTTSFNELKEQYEDINEKYSAKLEAEKEEKLNALFDSFSKDLTEDEINSVKSSIENLSFEEIETKLFALVGKKKVKFSVDNKKNTHLSINDIDPNYNEQPKKSYYELFEKFNKNR